MENEKLIEKIKNATVKDLEWLIYFAEEHGEQEYNEITDEILYDIKNELDCIFDNIEMIMDNCDIIEKLSCSAKEEVLENIKQYIFSYVLC